MYMMNERVRLRPDNPFDFKYIYPLKVRARDSVAWHFFTADVKDNGRFAAVVLTSCISDVMRCNPGRPQVG